MSGSGGGELRVPIFNGKNFDFWQIKMKTIFRSHELWEMVENGYKILVKEETFTEAEKKLLREYAVKDARALGIIQGAVSDQIFPRIATQESAKAVWDILKQEFVGDKQVRSVKLQGLRRDFEYTRMNDSETLSGYIAKLFDLINQMKSYGEDLSNQRIVQKLLISLPKSYDSIAAVIENTKDLDTIDAQDVVAILKGQNNQNKSQKSKWKPWSNKAEWSNKASSYEGNNKANYYFCDKLHYGDCWVKNKVKCHKCNKIGHIARYCNTNKTVQQGHFANQVEETGNLFYANHTETERRVSDEWYIDSGCSNHMTSREDLLVDIDRRVKAKVQVGTGVLVDVAGKRTLVIETTKGKRYIKEVMLVPGLAENLLNVGQMTDHGYFLLFGDCKVDIFDDRTLQHLVVSVRQKGNRCFPLVFNTNKEFALKTSVHECSKLWHKRFGHLNFKSLKLLQTQELVLGLPEIQEHDAVCHGCAMGKNHREAFPQETKWRAMEPLERQLTISYSPQQNGVAERKNRTVMEMAKCMIHEKELPYNLWCEVVNTAVYLLNRSPTKALESSTPFERFSGRKPGIKHLKVFGSMCYPLVPGAVRHKLEATSVMGVFIGYDICEKGYRIFNPITQKVILSRDVIFDEHGKWDWEKHKVKEICIPLSANRYTDMDRTTDELENLHKQNQDQVTSDDTQVESEIPLATEGGESSSHPQCHV
ncbi:unnamed protein product [Prunus brigantina]